MRRRSFVRATAASVGAALLAACGADGGTTGDHEGDGGPWRMPDEGEPHRRTWMAFAADPEIWGADLVPQVQRDLALIATTIARFEPVSMLVPQRDLDVARGLLTGADVELVVAELDDLWIRDTGPTFVTGPDGVAGIDLNFNGWGRKQRHRADARVAGIVTEHAGVPRLRTDLVIEGGALEVDGEGTAVVTESCVLNDNRNPGWTHQDVEAELRHLVGVTKVIWLPGVAGMDITDGHTDFYARFAGPGVVVAALDEDPDSFDHEVTLEHLDILGRATDARGRPLTVEVLTAPAEVRAEFADDDFAAGYVNFYLCNGAVIAPEFGDGVADAAAHDLLARLFPEREVVQIAIDGIAAGGGGIHCATQQEIAH